MSADPYVGTTLAGKYLVLTRLGEGGMGIVYEAENTSIARRVAIKILNAAFARHATLVERFAREARAATRTGHPNIVDVLDMGETNDGIPFIVMEKLDGEELLARLARNSPLQPTVAVDIVLQILSALEAAHGAGIVHRDLKPENVFLVRRGKRSDFVKVLDFGVALFDRTTETGNDRLTQGGLVMGTPMYMSPEQAAGRDVDQRTDLYATGVMLYEMLSGRLPYGGGNYNETILAIATTEPPPLALVAAWVPQEIAAIVHRAMARDPRERFQYAAQFAAALEPFVEAVEIEVPEHSGIFRHAIASPRGRTPTLPVEALRRSSAPPVPQGPSRRPLVVGALLAVAVLAGVAVFALGAGSNDAAPRAHEAAAVPEPPVARSAAPEAPAAPRMFSLDVTSEVAGAHVTLDGRPLGTTPLHTMVPAAEGDHVLRVEAEGRDAVERTITLAGPVALAVDLPRPAGPTKAARRRGQKLIFDDDVY